MPNISNLVQKIDYDPKIIETENKINANHDHNKYISIQEFNKLTGKNCTARLVQANLPTKNDIAKLDNKLKNVNKNVSSNKNQALVENELNELSEELGNI